MGGGGASAGQVNTAVGNVASAAQTDQQRQADQYAASQQAGGQATRGYSDLAANGLPFYRNMTDYNSGTIAQAFAPQRAALLRQTGTYMNMPSGYRDALLTNLGAQQGRAFDSSLQNAYLANQQAKMQGLAGLQGAQQIYGGQGLNYGAQAGQNNQAVLNAPRQPSVGGILGGALTGGANAFLGGYGKGLGANA